MKDFKENWRELIRKDAALRMVLRERAWRELLWAEQAEPAILLSDRQNVHGAWAHFWLAVETYRNAARAYGALDPEHTNPVEQGQVLQDAKAARHALEDAARRLLILFGAEASGRGVDEMGELCRKLATDVAEAGHRKSQG
jgi:hypothetical protein